MADFHNKTDDAVANEDNIFEATPVTEPESQDAVVTTPSCNSETRNTMPVWTNPADKVIPPGELTFPLTKEKLFKLSLSVNDPMRPFLGFFYEKQLRTECEALIRLPLFTVEEIYCAWSCRRANPWFFRCCAIDYILMAYLSLHQQREEW